MDRRLFIKATTVASLSIPINVPLNSDLGSTSIVDTGTDFDQVHLNADIVYPIESVQNIAGLIGTQDDQQINMKGWHTDSDIGGGVLYWDAAKLKSTHNGGTVFSPTVPYSATTADYLSCAGETDSGGAGCWLRISLEVTVNMFGYQRGRPFDYYTVFVKPVFSGAISGLELSKYSASKNITEYISDFRMPFYFNTNQTQGEIIGSLEKYFPDGWDIAAPENRLTNYINFQAAWSTTGTTDVYRTSVNPWNGPQYLPSNYVLGASLVDNMDGTLFNPVNVGAANMDFGGFRTYVNSSGVLETVLKIAGGTPANQHTIQIPVENPGLGSDAVFVDVNLGSNSNSGNSWTAALQGIEYALTLGKKKIFVAAGVYIIGSNMSTYKTNSDVTIECVGKVTQISSVGAGTWATTAYNNVYSSSYGSTCVGVFADEFYDQFGVPLLLEQKASIAEVEASPSSWFQDGGGDVYIRMPSDENPSTLKVYPFQVSNMRNTSDANVMIIGSDFIGGSAGAYSVRDASIDATSIVVDCGFYGQYNSDGYQIKGIGKSIAINSRCARNANDGFNYHAQGNDASLVNVHFIEVGCVGLLADAAGSGNGSTAHEQVKGVRINCSYHYNKGKAVADIQDTKTVNVNLVTSNSGPDSNADGYSFSDDCQAWLINSITSGNSGSGVRIYNDASLTLLGDSISVFDVLIEDQATILFE